MSRFESVGVEEKDDEEGGGGRLAGLPGSSRGQPAFIPL